MTAAARFLLKFKTKWFFPTTVIGFFCLLNFPLLLLAAQDEPNVILYSGDTWSIRELTKAKREIPSASASFSVFTIVKNDNQWIVGGSLYEADAELIYVDRLNRTIGPFTSSNNPLNNLCAAKNLQKSALAKIGRYNACRSEFYSANAFNKVGQALIMCTILWCIGGYDSDWDPVFRPRKFKNLVLGQSLMPKFMAEFRDLQTKNLLKNLETLEQRTKDELNVLNGISSESEDINDLSSGQQQLRDLARKNLTYLTWFQNSIKVDRSLSFDLSKQVKDRERNSLIEYDNVKKQIDGKLQKISAKIVKKEIAAQAEKERVRLANISLIRDVQKSLKDKRYYSSKIDGVFGTKMSLSLRAVSLDIGLSLKALEMEEIIERLEELFFEAEGSCPGSYNDRRYSACFSIDVGS